MARSATAPATFHFNASVAGFPAVVLVRFDRGMRWPDVLKALKAITHEIHDGPVRWKDINVFEALWETRAEEDVEWPAMVARGRQLMFEVAADGSYESVGRDWREPEASAPTP